MNTQQILMPLVLVACIFPAASQSQDAGNALNLFQNLLRGGQPAQQQAAPQPASPGGLAGSLFSGFVGGPAARPATGDLVQMLSQSLEQIDEPKEIEIGRQLAALLMGSKLLFADLAMQRYINLVGRWISLHSSRPDLPWTFAVLDDPGFNAFATPGGYVFVTRGLMDRVTDEAELAGILAHEITHVTARHHLVAMNKAARAGLLTQLIGSQFKNDVGGMLSAQLLGLGKNMYTKGLDQDDELDADRTGVALAARAGFDPYGLVAVLQNLRTASPDDAFFALSLSTHPPAQLRLNQLELAMGTRLDAFAGQPAVTVAQRVDNLAAANRRANAQAIAPARPTPAKKN